jgi:hypothetical protein
MILVGAKAALEDAVSNRTPPKKRRRHLPAGQALLLGAGLMAAARLAAGSRGREMLGAIGDRISDLEERLGASDILGGVDQDLEEDLVPEDEADVEHAGVEEPEVEDEEALEPSEDELEPEDEAEEAADRA